ncbi:hydrogenase expression/formation protein [Paracoccus sp. p4-l81]|uniref:hydrogenase expression/formation protein n=1 Tax=Paracoccus sp. p4-l81 TaxID=3342806 RepID=UPI0035B8CAB7
MATFHLPPAGFGPGSQPEDDELIYTAMPSGMRTYAPHLPEVDDGATAAPVLALLARVADACDACAATGQGADFDLTGLSPAARRLLAETLGQGEVAMKIRGAPALAVQESVFAGVWAIAGSGIDRIEVAPAPALASRRAHLPHRPALGAQAARPAGVVNAPALISELADASAAWVPGKMAYVVNLTLLPHTPEDLDWLDRALGEGATTILSRGYGNCRVTATALDHVWKVQFFNSMDSLILDTFEVTAMPEVALAAPEDLADSAARIRQVIEAIR